MTQQTTTSYQNSVNLKKENVKIKMAEIDQVKKRIRQISLDWFLSIGLLNINESIKELEKLKTILKQKEKELSNMSIG
jgi:hypothetical protein